MFAQKMDESLMAILSVSCIAVFVIVLTIFVIKQLKYNHKYDYPLWNDVSFSIVLTTLAGGAVFGIIMFTANSVFNATHSTDKISEASSFAIDGDFRNKVIEVSKIDSLAVEDNSGWVDEGPKISDFKSGGFYETSGLKDGQKVNVVVFFKGDEMNVTVESPNNDAVNVEKYSYVPKK